MRDVSRRQAGKPAAAQHEAAFGLLAESVAESDALARQLEPGESERAQIAKLTRVAAGAEISRITAEPTKLASALADARSSLAKRRRELIDARSR